jgi:glycosyltransferase involved in cell wall biosynthesis
MTRSTPKVAYLPLTSDLSGPGDRRRFCYYARARHLDWEIFRAGASYDIVVLGPLADLTHFSRMPRSGPKLVYDMPDSYLEIDESHWRSRLRGAAKFAFRQHRHFEWDYKDSLRKMFARADAVVCSTDEQGQRIAELNANVHPILDFQTEIVSRTKEDYRAAGETLQLFWEGIGGNLIVFDEVREALVRLSKRRRIALHLFTDVWQKPFNAPVPELPTRRLLHGLRDEIPIFMYEWNAFMLASIATACDLALIPIVMDDPLFRAKAENKLLLLWRMGVPTITSATPAYVRTMDAAGVRMYARTVEEWEELLERFGADEGARKGAALAGRRYVTTEHSEAASLAKWDAVFESVGSRVRE